MNASNQVSTAGFTFDGAGNETHDATFAYVWNAESEIKTGGGVNYTYDGDGDRVEKSNGKIYWYGAGSEILDESDGSGNFTDEFVFFGGKRIAMRNVSTGVIYYYAEDLLGSSRSLATSSGTLCYDADFFPFGGEHDYTSSCAQNYKFEGKERDAETDNDDFDARYYSSTYGRFLSADWSAVPAPVPYANLTNPQTLNLYAMVSDNPESFADLSGHFRLLPPSEGGGCFTPEAPACYGDDSMDSSEPQAQAQQNAQGQTAQQQTDCHCGTDTHFKTANQAATAALNKIFSTSEKQHVEYGGRVYRNADGTYSYTSAVTQHKATEVDLDAGGREGSRIPLGTTNAGMYHTHEMTPGGFEEGFSYADAAAAVREHVPSYIETPSGLIHEINGTNATSFLTTPQYTWRVNGPIP